MYSITFNTITGLHDLSIYNKPVASFKTYREALDYVWVNLFGGKA